jgi:Tfp pilus assembly protein PilV
MLASEQGSLLIEVMVGALVLAIATFAIMSGLDGAQTTAQTNKQRSTAATLAQQDIERLRAYPITALSNFEETRTVNVAGVPYTVHTQTDWIRDASGTLNCTDDSAQADYLKISSTVQSRAQNTPVKEVSLLTPGPGAFAANTGTLVVKLTDRAGQPLTTTSVSLSGPGSFSDTTNGEGCAIFGFIPAGDYQVEVPGKVSWGGAGATAEASVVAGSTSLEALEMESPATLTANFQKPDGTSATWHEMTVAHAKLPGGAKEFAAGGAVTSIDAPGLFPFFDGYGVYAGTCQRNNPANWQADYFAASGKGFVQLNPTEDKDVLVEMGTLRVNIQTSSGAASSGRVYIRQGDSGNGCTLNSLFAANTAVGATGVADFVLPFGTYRICVSNSSNGRSTSTVNNPTTSTSPTSTNHPRVVPPSSKNQVRTMRLPNSNNGGCSTS